MGVGRYKPKGFRVKGRSRQDIRADAHTVLDVLRAQMGIRRPTLPIVDVVEWLDEKGIIELDVLGSGEMDGKAAELQPVPNGTPRLCINESVYEGACEGGNFGRFTLAHELGHYFLHSRQPIPLARTSITPDHPPFEDSEWQANTFAGELLVDSRLVGEFCKNIADVTHVFGVSHQTAEIQWGELIKNGDV